MKVLMLGWEFPPFISGGLGTACYGLTKGLTELGVQVLFVLPRAVYAPRNSHVTLLTPALSSTGAILDPDEEEESTYSQDIPNLQVHSPMMFRDQLRCQGHLVQGRKHIHKSYIHICPFFGLLFLRMVNDFGNRKFKNC